MPRGLLLLCWALSIPTSQGCGNIVYSSLGDDVLLPCVRNMSRPTNVPTSPPLEQNQDPLPIQWHFLAPSGETHPLVAWHPYGKYYTAQGTRQTHADIWQDFSLGLRTVMLRDAGQYICFESDIFGATIFLHNITLIITGPPVMWCFDHTPSLLPLLMGALFGSKCLILVIVLGCTVIFGRKKEQSTYVNVTE